MLSLGVNVTFAVLIPTPVYAAPAEMQFQSGVNAAVDKTRTNDTQMTILQNAARASSVWNKLNVRKGETLLIDMQSTWSHMASITDLAPSTFAGTVTAAGHLYLINTNGIIFANGAQVNVGSLTATSLNLSNELFMAGVYSGESKNPIFTGTTGYVMVKAGAEITTSRGGKVLIFAPNVENRGLIKTPEGQTILAAGQKIYMTDSSDPAGFLVEVDGGGTVTNKSVGKIISAIGKEVDTGTIIADRGNIQLVGIAVNQEGRLSATTSVRANGSIRLVARDTVLPTTLNGVTTLKTKRTGTVTLGENSVTEVLPAKQFDPVTDKVIGDDLEASIDAQTFKPSKVEIQGKQVNILGEINAPGGTVDVSAVVDPSTPTLNKAPEPGTRIYVGEKAKINVASVQNVAVAMDRHQLEVKLFTEQLKDAPLLRGGPLYRQAVYVDAREDTPLFDTSASVALKGKTVTERLAVGGTVSLKSEGDVVTRAGSSIDVSGGSVQYQGGEIKTSKLTYQGKLYDISVATPDRPYDGQIVVTRKEQGYVEGKNAGSVTVEARALALDGDLKGNTVIGPYQRELAKRPLGALLQIGTLPASGNDFIAPGVKFVNGAAVLPVGFGETDPLLLSHAQQFELDTKFLSQGFSRLLVYSNGRIDVDAPLAVAPGGSVELHGNQMQIAKDITAPSGSITLKVEGTAASAGGNLVPSGDGSINIASGVTVSAAGLWTNDTPGVAGALTAPIAPDGGQITIDGALLSIGTGAVIDVSSGAWRTVDGKLKTGDASKTASISLGFSELKRDGELRAYAFDNRKRELNMKTSQNVQIGGANPNSASVLWLPENFFQSGGFTQYKVSSTAAGSQVVVAANSTILPRALNYEPRAGYGAIPSGAALSRIAQPVLLSEYQRRATDLELAALAGENAGGSLYVGKGATIQTDPGGRITLTAGDNFWMDGSLIAPGGAIKLTLGGGFGQPFIDTQSLWLGSSARVLARGHYRTRPTNNGLIAGELFDGGSIDISAGRGYLFLEQGSVLDVSGVAGPTDLRTATGYQRVLLAGSGGLISLAAREGLLAEGDLLAAAGGAGAAGGELRVALNGSETPAPNIYPTNDRRFVLSKTRSNLIPLLTRGVSIPQATYNGLGWLGADQIQKGGFDRLSMSAALARIGGTSKDRIELEGGLNVNLAAALSLQAPIIALTGVGDAILKSAYINLGRRPESNIFDTSYLARGNHRIEFIADWIDLNGSFGGGIGVSGASTVALKSRLDIRGYGSDSISATDLAGVTTPADIELVARQIYPASNTGLSFTVTGEDLPGQAPITGKITVASSGEAPVPVFSAGGRLALSADRIELNKTTLPNGTEVGGTLKAPVGSITLTAKEAIVLADKSLVSTSTEGLAIPYGTTGVSGWGAPATSSGAGGIELPPEKRIVLKAPTVDTQTGATVDISGGGDLFAYEWIPGIGGTKDVLGDPGVYAILPGFGGEYAPYDFTYNRNADPKLRMGDAVYLDKSGTLAAGVYTLLPARYALLPGAYMVKPVSGSSAVLPGQSTAQIDGSSVVSGFRAVLDTGTRSAAWGSYQVTPGSVFYSTDTFSRAPAEYQVTSANQYFAAKAVSQFKQIPRLPQDAGQLVLSATNTLALNGIFKAQAGAGGAGALVDIDAPSIRVVSVSDPLLKNVLQLEAAKLSALGAESLLLGGTRATVKDGVEITTSANDVTFANDANNKLSAPEIIAVATTEVKVEKNAYVEASGAEGAQQGPLLLKGEGALLRVATVDREISRSGVPAAPAKGDLSVYGTLKGKAVALDATRVNTFVGVFDIAQGGSLNIGAPRISLGDAGAVSGFQFGKDDLANLAQIGRLVLRSYSTLDVYKPFNDADGKPQALIDNTGLDLVVDAAGIAGYGAAGDTAKFNVASFTLQNPITSDNPKGRSFVTAPAKSLGTGGLEINATSITVGSGALTVEGFDTTTLAATGLLALDGAGSIELKAKQSTLKGGWIGAKSDGTSFDVTSTGSLKLAGNTLPQNFSAPVGQAAKLTFKGTRVDLVDADAVNGVVAPTLVLPSGDLTLQATSGDVTLGKGATLLASGLSYDFEGAAAYTPGGAVRLVSDQGNVAVKSGAVVNVSAQGDADAGLVTVSAIKGVAAITGTLNGQSSGGRTGRFQLDAKYANQDTTQKKNDFDQLTGVLEAGKFGEERVIRLREGDVALNSSVNAHRVVLSADKGKIDVYGKINASGVKGGEIALYGKDQVTLHTTAELDASATGAGQTGGTVTLATQTFALDGDGKPLGVNLNGGTIKVDGGKGGLGGTVQLRAPRNIANNDLAIAAINSVISGARAIRAEGYKSYPDSTITSSDFATSGDWYKDAASFMKQTGTIRSRLNMAGNSAFALAPGVDVESATDLTLSNDWSLAAWRYDPDTGAIAPVGQLASGLNANGNPLLAGVLTLRAAGDLKLNASLSDGFDTALASGTAQGLNAWSYRLVAGADIGASPLAVKKGTGNISLASSKLIRTGRGDIDIAAGGNLTLGNDASVIYTAGSQAAPIADFTLPASGKLGKSPYLDGGGHVYIRVDGDLIGKVANKGSQQLVNNWLFRQGELNADGSYKLQTSWWLRPDEFKAGVATLGGGDIVLEAGGKIENLSAAAPTSGRVAVDPVTGAKLDAVVLGGGDLLVRAGGDILSGVYHLGHGEGRIIAGGKIASASNSFGTTLSLQDASFHVQSARGTFLETAFNPTLAAQATKNASSTLSASEPSAYFSTYGGASGVSLTDLSGNVSFSTALVKANLLSWVKNNFVTSGLVGVSEGWGYYPGSLRATAFGGDVLTQSMLLYPAKKGQLALLASGSVLADKIIMSDADLNVLPGVLNPIRQPKKQQGFDLLQELETGHSTTLPHKGDRDPVYVVAGKSIMPFSTTQGIAFTLNTPKQARIHAGLDISNLDASIQNLSPSDLSIITAGRKLHYTVNDSKIGIRIAGPGELLVTAGNDVDLGKSGGIQSIANTVNNFLPPTGANVTVGAGFGGGVDVAAFVALYIDPTGSKASPETKVALTAYMRQVKSDANLSDADAWAAFAAMDTQHQTPFAFRVFSDELRESRKGPERGDAAIAVLFPGQHYDGDLLMFESQIRTALDSSIDLLVPGGEINAGLAGATTTRDIGIITEKGGEIRAFADAGFYVNQSKVITQYGSDIVVWVTDGDIDAGRGSTTALSVPKLFVSTDVDGNTTQETKGVAAGSGIRAQTYDPDGPSGPGVAPSVGTVVLRAHRGTLNAADAGIEAGNLDVSAQVVLGTDAIQVSGSVSGVSLNTSSLAPPPSPSVDQKSSEESTKSLAKNIGDTQKALEDTKKALENFKPSFITVEVVGFGETGSANAGECRREDGSIDPACKQRLKDKGI